MKSIKLLLIGLLAACACAACGSGSSEETPGPQTGGGTVVGEWHLVSWSSLSAADVYLSLAENGTFELYQRLTKPVYEHFDGTYRYADGTLSGVYGDGVAWGASYRVSFGAGGSQMTLTAGADDVAVFVKAAIPEEIRSGELGAKASARTSEEAPRFL